MVLLLLLIMCEKAFHSERHLHVQLSANTNHMKMDGQVLKDADPSSIASEAPECEIEGAFLARCRPFVIAVTDITNPP